MSASAVVVRRGALADVPGLVAAAAAGGGAFVVTDGNVAARLPPSLLAGPHHVLAPGEASKSWDALAAVLRALDGAGVDRDGHLFAIGGGVVTDLGGLAASLHRRGIAWTAVPTTLVGQVDAAAGGKTAVNLGDGKNTVGTFHMPRRLVVDPGLLASLPERELRAGLAEVLKTALVSGEALLADVEARSPRDFAEGGPAAVAIIERCLAVKGAIVAQDPNDEGVRQQLNLGHTFGHAFEREVRPPLRHGEAVGLGLLCAARLAALRDDDAVSAPDRATPGLEDRVRAALIRWGLPVAVRAELPSLLAQMRRDKKRRGGGPVFVVPLAPGRLQLVHAPPAGQVEAALQAALEPASTS